MTDHVKCLLTYNLHEISSLFLVFIKFKTHWSRCDVSLKQGTLSAA